MTRPARIELDGVIASTGFASGDRVVIGYWQRSPLGPMCDVMWASPEGTRLLLAPSLAVAELVSAVYRFDRVEVVPFTADGGPRWVSVRAGDRVVQMRAGPGVRLPVTRPPWFTRRVEAPVARRLLGVRTYGVSPTGVREWYRARAWRPVTWARGEHAGRDLGSLAPVDPPTGFGVSEPPRRPAIVSVRPLLVDPSGRLEDVVARFAP